MCVGEKKVANLQNGCVYTELFTYFCFFFFGLFMCTYRKKCIVLLLTAGLEKLLGSAFVI